MTVSDLCVLTTKLIATRIAPLILCGFLTGCAFPYHFTSRMGAEGTAVDATTMRPVTDAAVSIRGRKTTGYGSTDSTGRFCILPKRFWSVYIVPTDPLPLRDVLTIEHSGYLPYQSEIHANIMYTGTQTVEEFGVVRLQPVGK